MEASTRTGATVKAGGGGGLGFLEAGTRVWVPHAAKAFCCAEVVGGHHASTGSNSSSSGQHLTVAYIHDDDNDDQAGGRKEPSKVVTVARADVLGRVEDNWLTPLDDLVDLAELSEPAILHHIKQRHARDLIYARDLAPTPRTHTGGYCPPGRDDAAYSPPLWPCASGGGGVCRVWHVVCVVCRMCAICAVCCVLWTKPD